MRCRKRTEWGRCAQTAQEGAVFCTVHEHFKRRGITPPDRYWHEKVVRGLITPTVDWMKPSELHAIINGRYRGDGRRVDQYVVGDPLLIDEDAFS
jgi:hypothetical protein